MQVGYKIYVKMYIKSLMIQMRLAVVQQKTQTRPARDLQADHFTTEEP